MVERLQKVWRTRDRLTVDGEPPSVHVLALTTGYSDNQVREAIKLGRVEPLSLDMPVGSEGEATLADLLDLGDHRLNAAYEVEFVLLQQQIHAVLDTLSEREAGVIAMRFGLTDGERKTLDEIGKVYGVTRERIRQIESKTISKLRHRSRSQALEEYFYNGGRRPRAIESDGLPEKENQPPGPTPSDRGPTNSQGEHGGRGEPSPESGWFRPYVYGAGHSARDVGRIELAPRLMVSFVCPNDHRFDLALWVEAEMPATWVCPRCGRVGTVAPVGTTAASTYQAAQKHRPEPAASVPVGPDGKKILPDISDEQFEMDLVEDDSERSPDAWLKHA